MLSNTFRYKNVGTNPATGTTYRPIIPIEITKKRLTFPTEALLDTGADFCIFSGEIGRALGIKIETGARHQVMGVGGALTKGFIHRIGITIPGFPMYSSWGFFSDGLNDMHPSILGQHGFFENFKVSFDYKKKHVVVRTR